MSNSNYPSRKLESNFGLIGTSLRNAWNPIPLGKPRIESDLTSLPALERIASVAVYTFMRLEYALSSGGSLRAWLKLNLLISLVLAVPTLVVFPVITWMLGSFATWSGYLVVMANNILWCVLLIAASIAVIMFTHFAVKEYMDKQSRDRKEKSGGGKCND